MHPPCFAIITQTGCSAGFGSWLFFSWWHRVVDATAQGPDEPIHTDVHVWWPLVEHKCWFLVKQTVITAQSQQKMRNQVRNSPPKKQVLTQRKSSWKDWALSPVDRPGRAVARWPVRTRPGQPATIMIITPLQIYNYDCKYHIYLWWYYNEDDLWLFISQLIMYDCLNQEYRVMLWRYAQQVRPCWWQVRLVKPVKFVEQ